MESEHEGGKGEGRSDHEQNVIKRRLPTLRSYFLFFYTVHETRFWSFRLRDTFDRTASKYRTLFGENLVNLESK